jgi:hypothetical protein
VMASLCHLLIDVDHLVQLCCHQNRRRSVPKMTEAILKMKVKDIVRRKLRGFLTDNKR